MPFRTGQELIPRLPEVVTHVYDLGTDGRIASDLGTIFGKYLDEGAHPLPYRFIDAFTFAATVENFPSSMGVGEVRTRPAMDVDFYGARFHNHTQFQYFDRVDVIGGVPHAFIKVQSPGNYMDRTHDESAWLLVRARPARRAGDRARRDRRTAGVGVRCARRDRSRSRSPSDSCP